MKDSIEYLATVVTAVVVGAWAFQNQLATPVVEFVNHTAKLLSGGSL